MLAIAQGDVRLVTSFRGVGGAKPAAATAVAASASATTKTDASTTSRDVVVGGDASSKAAPANVGDATLFTDANGVITASKVTSLVWKEQI